MKKRRIIFNGRLNPLDDRIPSPEASMTPVGFSDASHADNTSSRRSTAGFVIFVAGAPVLWKSGKQSFVTLSTTEAEFITLTPAARALAWVRQILYDFGHEVDTPLLLFTDSNNAMKRCLNPHKKARARHVDICHRRIIEQDHDKHLSLQHVPSADMTADGFTKPLDNTKHAAFVKHWVLVIS